MTGDKLDIPKKEVVVVELTPKTVEDELKELKTENADMKKTLMKLKNFTNKNYHYLFDFKDEKI